MLGIESEEEPAASRGDRDMDEGKAKQNEKRRKGKENARKDF